VPALLLRRTGLTVALAVVLAGAAATKSSASPKATAPAAAPSPTSTATLDETLSWLATFVSGQPLETAGAATAYTTLTADAGKCTIVSKRIHTETSDSIERSFSYSDLNDHWHRVTMSTTTTTIPLYDLSAAKMAMGVSTACLARIGWFVNVAVSNEAQPTITWANQSSTAADCYYNYPYGVEAGQKTCPGYPTTIQSAPSVTGQVSGSISNCLEDRVAAERVKRAVEHATALCADYLKKPRPSSGEPF
jgi:hypothetical protein